MKNNTNLGAPFSFILPTRIEYGTGCLAKLPDILKEAGVKRPLLVTDKGIKAAGIVDKVTSCLDAAGVTYLVFDNIEPNPKDYNVEEGAAVAREFGADSIIAVGGGSPIDCSKSIGVLLAHDADKIKPYEGKTGVKKAIPPLFTVPTTSGTGSELTFSSVITDTANQYKMTVKSPLIAASVALCDPELTVSVPPSVTAATGVDALTHAIEAYTANCSEPFSDAVALYAIELIYNNLETAVKDGANIGAREAMLMGSMLAGVAFSHSDVASVHCIAETLGGIYDLPHGLCNAIFLPHMMEYNSCCCQDKYARVARAMGLEFKTEEEGAAKAVAAVQKLCLDVGLPEFKSLNVPEESYERIAEISARNISTESNPRPMAVEDYIAVLRMASK